MKEFFNKFKYVKLKDIVAIFKMIVALPCSIIYKIYLKIKKREIWVICEDEFEARDNGYWLFKYIREKYPNMYVYYAINYKSPDYEKVKKLGNIIKYGGMEHWIKYLSATKNISSHKGRKAKCCGMLCVRGLWYTKKCTHFFATWNNNEQIRLA